MPNWRNKIFDPKFSLNIFSRHRKTKRRQSFEMHFGKLLCQSKPCSRSHEKFSPNQRTKLIISMPSCQCWRGRGHWRRFQCQYLDDSIDVVGAVDLIFLNVEKLKKWVQVLDLIVTCLNKCFPSVLMWRAICVGFCQQQEVLVDDADKLRKVQRGEAKRAHWHGSDSQSTS